MTIKSTDVSPVDMSPEGIDRRFRMVESLRKLCVSLMQAGDKKSMNRAKLKPHPHQESTIDDGRI